MSAASPETVYFFTLNCARLPQNPSALAAAIAPTLPSTAPGLILLSLQEIAPLGPSFLGGTYLAPYLDAFAAAVALATTTAYSDAYALHGSHNVGLTALLVFAHPALALPAPQWAGVGLGVLGLGNKGALGVRLALPHTRLTAVAVHWAPHESGAARRDADWAATARALAFDGAGLFDRAAHLVVFGDLNYRTAGARPAPRTPLPDRKSVV